MDRAATRDAAVWAAFRVAAVPPPPVDAFQALGFTPNPGPQTRFLELPDHEIDVLYGGAAGGSKMQRVDEPIATPTGWTTMGELRPGDQIFSETGAVITVTETHPVDPRPVCYRFTFDDGSTMDSHAGHQWLTLDARELAALTKRDPEYRARRRASRPSRATGQRSETFTAAITDRNRQAPPAALDAPTGSVRTTQQIADSLRTVRGRANHAIPVAGALNLPPVDLPIDPYVLGAWLGDGTSAGSGFTSADSEIVDAIRAAGITVTDKRSERHRYRYILGDTIRAPRSNGRPGLTNTFTTDLRHLGVLGNKHIPMAYLRASLGQRLALLQGLMDTDGTATATGQISFTTTSPRLAGDVYELIVSLGWKTGRTESRAKIGGKDCGPVWTMKWSADRIVFRLPRKAARQKLATRRTTQFRYVVECEAIEPTPMRCITVDNPTHLYLAGRAMVPTHNSTSLLMYALRSCSRYPGLQAFWFRRTFPELQQSVLRALARYGYARALNAKWNASRHELIFVNGSVLTFGHAKNLVDATALLSAEINLLLIDERTTIPPDVVDYLYTRVRSGVAGVPCLGIRSATNPGGVGHTRVKADYIEATNRGEVEIFEDRNGRRRIFIQAKASDTPQLGESYRRGLAGLGEALAKAYLDGDWDIFAGQMYGEWRYDRHTVAPWTLPPTWRRARGVDYGFTAPYAVVWAAIDNDGRLWFYRDLSRTQVIERDQARLILAAEAGEQITWTPADPSMWAKKGEAKAPADIYAEEGVYLTPANNDRIIGWQRIHSYLADGPACELHRALGWTTCPMMHVFTTCSEIIRTLPALPHATTGNPEDANTKADDHIPDATRYLCMSLGGGPEFVELDPSPAGDGDLPVYQSYAGQYATPVPVDTPTAETGWWDISDDDGPRPGGVVIVP